MHEQFAKEQCPYMCGSGCSSTFTTTTFATGVAVHGKIKSDGGTDTADRVAAAAVTGASGGTGQEHNEETTPNSTSPTAAPVIVLGVIIGVAIIGLLVQHRRHATKVAAAGAARGGGAAVVVTTFHNPSFETSTYDEVGDPGASSNNMDDANSSTVGTPYGHIDLPGAGAVVGAGNDVSGEQAQTRCSRCHAKSQFCVCDVRRTTGSMMARPVPSVLLSRNPMYSGATAAETVVDEETYEEITAPISTITTTDGVYETADPVGVAKNGMYETAESVPTPGATQGVGVGSNILQQSTCTVNDHFNGADEYLEVHDVLTNVAGPTASFGDGPDG